MQLPSVVKRIFAEKAKCATCHVPPIFTEPGWNLRSFLAPEFPLLGARFFYAGPDMKRAPAEDAAKKLLDEARREASKDDARAAFLLGLYREQQ
jgi:hypothetical protein